VEVVRQCSAVAAVSVGQGSEKSAMSVRKTERQSGRHVRDTVCMAWQRRVRGEEACSE